MSTPPLPCRVLPFTTADGPRNMATDAALLDALVQKSRGDVATAVMRVYEWSVATLTLGYFQRAADATEDPRLSGLPLVRRPSGGGAIVHDQELTYAIVLPPAHPLARGARPLYQAAHAAVATVLADLGLPAARHGDLARDRTELTHNHFDHVSNAPRTFLCFQDRDDEDLVATDLGHKIVGGAQRRRAGVVLMHGSILLARSTHAPALPGATDLGAVNEPRARTAERLVEALSERLCFVPRRDGLDEHESALARDLEVRVYRDPAWTFRR